MKRLLALDIGRKKTGVAVTDTNRIIASALETVPTGLLEDFLRRYMADNPVEVIVIGMPTTLHNTPSDSTQYIMPVVNRLRRVFPKTTFDFVDERFTSQLAFQTIIDAGTKKMKRRDKTLVDKVSATIILQSYLENQKHKQS